MKEHGLFYCVYEKGWRNPEEMNEEQLEIMGRSLARIHSVGALRDSKYRIKMNPETYGDANLKFLESTDFLLPDISDHYKKIATELINESKKLFEGVPSQRIHGDKRKYNSTRR